MSLDIKKLKFFADYIQSELGIVYSESNYFQLNHRLDDIALQLGYPNSDALYNKAMSGISGFMKDLLLDSATNNETSFFRDPNMFAALEKDLFPKILTAASFKGQLKIWSAACSTGQEVYSVIMILNQLAKSNPTYLKYEYLATDFSERVLKKAKSGEYSQLEIQRGLSSRVLVQNFVQKEGTSWQIKDDLKRNITFKKLNLLDPFVFSGPFNLVLCRNVLIYQEVKNKIKIIEKIKDLMPTGGVLVMGAAESMLGISQSFEMYQSEKSTFYIKK